MKTSIDFLPLHKQEQLQAIRDEYTEDGIIYQYPSNFDILVISGHNLDNKARDRWHQMEREVRHMTKGTPVSLIHEGIKDVNQELRRNSYFYIDIYKEGILLHDSGQYRLNPPRTLSEAETLAKAREDFGHWYKSTGMFYESYESNFQKGNKDSDYLKIAVFELHQAVERYYVALILVFTGYRPKTHSLKELGEQAQRIHERFKVIFPIDIPEQKVRYELLCRAYIDARTTASACRTSPGSPAG